jgi:hypothetical protein
MEPDCDCARRKKPETPTATKKEGVRPVPLIAVESTVLSAVAYDAKQQLLELQFRDRAIYRYFNVPATVHAELMEAQSKGEFFNLAIRGHFRYALASNNPTSRQDPAPSLS